MIFSVLLRNYKAYRGWHYIPVSNGNYFSALIGDNGVGKSSVLEALDTFFNKPLSEWNYNHSISKAGFDRAPEICPIFIIEKSKINKTRNLYKYLETISRILWQFEKDDYNSSHTKLCVQIHNHISTTLQKVESADEKYFIFPLSIKKISANETDYSLSIFESNAHIAQELQDDNGALIEDVIEELLSYVRSDIEYIYIPSEINYETYTKIEGKTIQSLMGTPIDSIIENLIDERVIRDINTGLDSFLKDIQSHLKKYEYKKPAKRQTLFNIRHLTSKIIETYFESKILNLKDNSSLTPIHNCSSGEKRKAVIDLAEAFILKSERTEKDNLVILVVDEPEVSLHTSSCFEQFEKLENISRNNVQTIISTHWYGFFPSVQFGSATYITNDESEKFSFFIDLMRFREDIRQIRKDTKGKMPNNIELKSINDLVQSIISSITSSSTKWIICEGASDKIYLNYFFRNQDDIKIVSVGGSKYVKKLFEYIYLALEEEKEDICGKIFLLLDTDKAFEKYSAKESIKQIKIRRLQASTTHDKIQLLTTSDNNYYPPTTIEDALDSDIFLNTLSFFHDNGYSKELKNLMTDISVVKPNSPSGIAFDLRESQKTEIEKFFSTPGVKVKFAQKYCTLSESIIPAWVDDISDFFMS
jgi:hypothetical protein